MHIHRAVALPRQDLRLSDYGKDFLPSLIRFVQFERLQETELTKFLSPLYPPPDCQVVRKKLLALAEARKRSLTCFDAMRGINFGTAPKTIKLSPSVIRMEENFRHQKSRSRILRSRGPHGGSALYIDFDPAL